MKLWEKTSKVLEEYQSYFFLIPLILGFFILFFRLSLRAFIDYDEAAFSEVVRETLKAHQFLSFRFINAPWFHKPPLYFWLAMAAVKIFPSIEFAMRSVSAIFGIALPMVVYAIAKYETKNNYVALASSLILLSIGSFVDLGQQVKTDLPVIFSIVFSYYSFIRATSKFESRGEPHKKRWLWFLLFGLGIGTGVLFKSVIGLLVFPLILIHSFFSKKWIWLKDVSFWFSIVLAGIIVAPWHIYETVIYGNTFWNNYLFGQVLERLTSNLFSSHLSLLLLFGLFILNTFPWMIAFIVSFFFLKRILRALVENNDETKKTISISLLVSASWIFFIFIIFSVSKTRIDYYLAPAYPFIALYVSYFGFAVWNLLNTAKSRKAFISVAVILSLFSIAGMISVGYDLLPQLSYEQHLAEDEKKIGLMLRNIPQSQTIYFYNQNYWETVRFYSQGKTLGQYVPGKESTGSLLVVLTPTLSSDPYFKSQQYNLLYKGNFVSLVKI